MGNHVAKHTKQRAKRSGDAKRQVLQLMAAYDKSKSGTLTRDEVKQMATDLCGKASIDIGGITDDELDQIMRCGGDTCQAELSADDLPTAVILVKMQRDCDEALGELFTKYDVDKSGNLPADQLQALLTEVNLGEAPTDADIAYILKQCEPRGAADPIEKAQLKAALSCWYIITDPVFSEATPPTGDAPPSKSTEPSEQRKIVEAVFKAQDDDGKGFIDRASLLTVIVGLIKGDEDAVRNLLSVACPGDSVEVSYAAFIDYLFSAAPVDTTIEKKDGSNVEEAQSVPAATS